MGLLGLLGFGGEKHDFYAEGYSDGQQYQAEYPDLGQRAFAQAQKSAEQFNVEELDYSESQNGQWQAGFVDSYSGYEYRESLFTSLDQFPSAEEVEQPSGVLGVLRRFFG